jgi:hypothetical protein
MSRPSNITFPDEIITLAMSDDWMARFAAQWLATDASDEVFEKMRRVVEVLELAVTGRKPARRVKM